MIVGLFLVTFLVTFALLQTVLFNGLIVLIGLGLLSWILADLVTKTIINLMPRKNIDPRNRAVFVTGCDTGFGYELAKRLDALGFWVYAGCLMPDRDGAIELKELCSDRLKIVSLDVTKDEHVAKASQEVFNSLGNKEFWAVVNNAGIAVYTEIEWCPVEVYYKIFNVNALGPIRITKAFLPLLRKSGGRVIIVASLAGRYTFPGFSAYSMSKHAAVSFADGLRREMKKWNISVHLIEPTLYKTPIAGSDALKSHLKIFWDSTPINIQESYGQEYFQAFQERLLKMTNTAKGNINEVVEDMVDAVAGDRPKTRYVPSSVVQMRARLLSSISTEMQDFLLCKTQPSCSPAAATRLKQEMPAFKRIHGELRRTLSEPPGTKKLMVAPPL